MLSQRDFGINIKCHVAISKADFYAHMILVPLTHVLFKFGLNYKNCIQYWKIIKGVDVMPNIKLGKKIIVILLFSLILIVGTLCFFGFLIFDELNKGIITKEDIANNCYFLTNDTLDQGPISCNGVIYFPTAYSTANGEYEDCMNESELQKYNVLRGRVIFNNGTDNYLLNVNLYKNPENDTYLIGKGDTIRVYLKSDIIGSSGYIKEVLKKTTSYSLSSDYLEDNSFSFPKNLIIQLVTTCPNIDYNVSDFRKCDNIYYIFADYPTSDGSTVADGTIIYTTTKIYIGCIMEVNNELYYGNLKNKLDDIQKTEIQNEIKKMH